MQINPNCSEVVVRLPGADEYVEAKQLAKEIKASQMKDKTKKRVREIIAEQIYEKKLSVSTDNYPNQAINEMIPVAESFAEKGYTFSKIPDIIFYDAPGGGGHVDYVERSWTIAKLCAVGVFTEEEAEEWDDNIWTDADERIISTRCRTCLDGEPDKDCPHKENLMKRLVGECEGLPGDTYDERLNEIIEKTEKKEQEAET